VNKPKSNSRFSALVLILGLAVLALGSLPLTGAASYDNVQIYIQTASDLPDYFTVSAFNMSGYLLASCQTQYPAASFELPDGQYIFTATAYYGAIQGSGVVPGLYTVPYCLAPVSEYGYAVEQIFDSTTLTVLTQNVTSFPTSTITVEVTYANGTAAEGVSVSASVLGSWYYWGYQSDVSMWVSTGADGSATLVTPQAPVQINAWNWVPVDLPQNLTTIQVFVAGEEVNVTVYWQPMYVGLAGSALVVPPGNNASISLHVQQPNYWATPFGVIILPVAGGVATAASGLGSIPVAVYELQQGDPQFQNYQSPGSLDQTVPEFPSIMVAPLFMTATLLAIVLHRRKSGQLK
jgi:hypothetical protein